MPQIEVRTHEGVTLLTLRGDVGAVDGDALARALGQAGARLAVDLRACGALDQSAVSLLLRAELDRPRGSVVVIITPESPAWPVLGAADTLTVFRVVDRLETAVALLARDVAG